jgi:hypothetical protein
LPRHVPDRPDAGALELGVEHNFALADAVLEVDPYGSSAQDLPYVLGDILWLLGVSPFHIGCDRDEAYAWFGEGFDTADLRQAKTLLAALA